MRVILVLCVLFASSVIHASASARSSQDYTYGFDQTWRSAVRLIAVDYRYSIVERDAEVGFMLFEYEDQGRQRTGSLELVRTDGQFGTPAVRVIVSIASMPSYVERVLIDHLSRKLNQDYGAAPRPRRPEPVAPPPDEDEDDDDDDDSDGDD